MTGGLALELRLTAPDLPAVFALLQAGVVLEVTVGCSVRELLGRQLGIDDEVQHRRISTIFLNHRVVDDPAGALIGDGDMLALSGAMPGLVGATMRRGGPLAALRDGISHQNPPRPPAVRRGRIRLKLFNLLLPELAPRILRRGILLPAGDCRRLLAACRPAEEPLPVVPPELADDSLLQLRILCEEANP